MFSVASSAADRGGPHGDNCAGRASLSIDYKLPMADAIIYATARAHQAELITSDAHFSGLTGVTLN